MLSACVGLVPSLKGLGVFYSAHPALKRWAILLRPASGTGSLALLALLPFCTKKSAVASASPKAPKCAVPEGTP